jgi:hypothetical protein
LAQDDHQTRREDKTVAHLAPPVISRRAHRVDFSIFAPNDPLTVHAPRRARMVALGA